MGEAAVRRGDWGRGAEGAEGRAKGEPGAPAGDWAGGLGAGRVGTGLAAAAGMDTVVVVGGAESAAAGTTQHLRTTGPLRERKREREIESSRHH